MMDLAWCSCLCFGWDFVIIDNGSVWMVWAFYRGFVEREI